jgi:hypothetical protein
MEPVDITFGYYASQCWLKFIWERQLDNQSMLAAVQLFNKRFQLLQAGSDW